MRSAAESPSSATARKRPSHALSASMRARIAGSLTSSRRSSYSVRPRLDARVGESWYTSFRNESTSEANDDGKTRPPSVGLNGPLPPLQDNGLERSVSLTEYQRKRDFKRTPEPKGRQPKAEPTRRYVVHRHHATRLHWDVRLEMRGILASWAVPQGPPLEGGKRRLAVHTEDHPIEYLDFSGVIPDGYGAGSMTIWDQGTYDLLKEDRKSTRLNSSH